jgi:aspartate carbamoyltransferase catalytic subunit
MKHLTRIDELDQSTMLELFARADAIRAAQETVARHHHRIVATLFYEPSTRTRLSFESAALRLGARCLGFSDPSASSASKGETLIDTIRTVQRYADLIVLRHPAEGAATLAAKVAQVPIINAGDGGHEHPSQTLFDLYTIWQRFGDLAGRTIGFVGDLRYGRTVHSLSHAAAMFGMKLVFIAPNSLQMPAHLKRRLEQHVSVRCVDDLASVIGDLDVLYVTRIQRERMDDQTLKQLGDSHIISPQLLTKARSNMLVLHPLPRVDEIEPTVDEDPRAAYFEQVANGVVMRMALLDTLLTSTTPLPLGAHDAPASLDDPPWRADTDVTPCNNARCVTNSERYVQPRWVTMVGDADRKRCEYCDAEHSR